MAVPIKDFCGEGLPKNRGRKYDLEMNGCSRELLNMCHSIIHLSATTMRSRVRSHITYRRRSLFIRVFHFRRLMPASVSNSSGSTTKKMPLQKTFGKLNRKDVGLHKLVFTEGLLRPEAEVGYYVRGKVALKGCIQGSGILCFCCDNVVTPSQFEAHAGEAQRRKPYNHIYLSNGMSLHEASVRLSKEGKLPKRVNDDLCNIFADGGTCCYAIIVLEHSTWETDASISFKFFWQCNNEDVNAKEWKVNQKVALKGCSQGSGILCFCCDNVATPSQSEAHAGGAHRHKPYNHIYLSNGTSLHEASVRLSKEGKLPKRENDDLCSICAYGGDLLLCASSIPHGIISKYYMCIERLVASLRVNHLVLSSAEEAE